ncbi:MAG: hypothetical protein KF805_12715 [Phycisphaeraceae bacterium]|nr:hypothetical protein [Phycisphaeraceae bacterium]
MEPILIIVLAGGLVVFGIVAYFGYPIVARATEAASDRIEMAMARHAAKAERDRQNKAMVAAHCAKHANTDPIATSPVAAAIASPGNPVCPLCSGALARFQYSDVSGAGCLLAIIVAIVPAILIAVVFGLFIPIVGLVFAGAWLLIVLVASPFIARRRVRSLRCRACGYAAEAF